MKKSAMKIITMVFIISFTSSCSNDFLIEAKFRGKSVSLEFYKPHSLFFYRKFRPCINWLTVYDESTPNRARIWHLKSSQGQCGVLESLTVGKVPNGFEEASPIIPMKVGHTYSVAAKDEKGIYGSSESWELH